MTLPKKLYDVLKFLITFIPYIVTIVSGLLLTFGVAESITNKIIFAISSVASIADAVIKTCAKNHWKTVAEDGTTEDIEYTDSDEDEYEDDDVEIGLDASTDNE